MSKKAADHHRKASEHFEQAALHHTEAATYHATNAYEKAAHHAYLAQAHQHHATHHAGEALQAHLNDHGSSPSADPSGSTGPSVTGAVMDVKETDSQPPVIGRGGAKIAKSGGPADKSRGATGTATQGA